MLKNIYFDTWDEYRDFVDRQVRILEQMQSPIDPAIEKIETSQ